MAPATRRVLARAARRRRSSTGCSAAHQRAVVVEVEELLARAGRLAGEGVGDVVAVEVNLEGLVAGLHALEQFLLDVRLAGGGEDVGSMSSWAKMSLSMVPGLITPGQRIATVRGSRLPSSYSSRRGRAIAAVGPGEFLRAVVGGIHHDGVLLEAEFLELVEKLANHGVMLDHAVGINAEPGLAFPFRA